MTPLHHMYAASSILCTKRRNLYDAFVGEAKAYFRLLAYAEKAEEEELPQIAALFRAVPSGVGSKRKDMPVKDDFLEQCLSAGAEAAVSAGFGREDDLSRIEAGGRIEGADAGKVSPRALSRGRPQLGTLGSGNHFVEAGVVDEVLNPEVA